MSRLSPYRLLLLLAVAAALLAAACGGSSGGVPTAAAPPTATAGPTIPALAADVSTLAATLEAPQRCIVVRYPQGWILDDPGNLTDGDTSRCPGGAEASGTTVQPSCGGEGLGQVVVQFGVAQNGDYQAGPAMELGYLGQRCQDLGEQLGVVAAGEQVTSVSVAQALVPGLSGRCIEGTRDLPVPLHLRACLLEVGNDVYGVWSWGQQSQWSVVGPVLAGIESTIELHPVAAQPQPAPGASPATSPAP